MPLDGGRVFHNWTDYNGVILFSRVYLNGGPHIFGIFWGKKNSGKQELKKQEDYRPKVSKMGVYRWATQ